MSQLLSSPQDCCQPCADPITTDIPGPQGLTGAAGTNGTNGINAYTTLLLPFTMPAEGATVLAEVGVSTWAAVGQKVFVGDPLGAALGTFQVITIPDGTHLNLLNIANTAASEYIENSAPGSVFPAASAVSPSGLQGPAGTAGASGAPVTSTYITKTPDVLLVNSQALSALSTGLAKVTTATGVVSTVAQGIVGGAVAGNDGALTPGDIVQATANGIKTDTAANTRTALGLGTMATQNANAVAITGGTIAGVSFTLADLTVAGLLAFTPSTLQVIPFTTSQVSANASRIRITAAGGAFPGFLLSHHPTITPGTKDGQILIIQGVDDAHSCSFVDDTIDPGTKVRLQANGRGVGDPGRILVLMWDLSDGLWHELLYTTPV